MYNTVAVFLWLTLVNFNLFLDPVICLSVIAFSLIEECIITYNAAFKRLFCHLYTFFQNIFWSEPSRSLFTEECGESTIGQKVSSFALFDRNVPLLPEIIPSFIASFHFKAIKDQMHGLLQEKTPILILVEWWNCRTLSLTAETLIGVNIVGKKFQIKQDHTKCNNRLIRILSHVV